MAEAAEDGLTDGERAELRRLAREDGDLGKIGRAWLSMEAEEGGDD